MCVCGGGGGVGGDIEIDLICSLSVNTLNPFMDRKNMPLSLCVILSCISKGVLPFEEYTQL